MSHIGHAVGRSSLVLWLYGLVASSVIAGTYLGTKDRIVQQQRQARERALAQIIPPGQHDNDLLDDTLILPDSTLLGHRETALAHRVRQGSKITAVILPVTATGGYAGPIEMIVGINRDGRLAGVRVLRHSETPGLGDKIETRKSDWITRFSGRSLTDPKPEGWRVIKDGGVFDQFTGATVTPRAVVKAIHQSLAYFDSHRDDLMTVRSDSTSHEQ
jgi:electron transport complex protein RnfG